VVENIKPARILLRRMDPAFPIDDSEFFELGKRYDKSELDDFLMPLLQGESIGLISDAGCPAVADPGTNIVSKAQEWNIRVYPLMGPTSLIMALMGSGLNGQRFSFNGYIPKEKSERIKRLKELETLAVNTGASQLFIETAFRNNFLIEDIIKNLRPSLKLCIAAGINTQQQYIKTQTIGEWTKTNIPDFSKISTVFILGT
jgi:16S rRNA (cytidine1402-2'-O)-methyltransferase